jgi:hypothetical protein
MSFDFETELAAILGSAADEAGEFTPAYTPVDSSVSLKPGLAEDTVVIGYLAQDEGDYDFWEENDGCGEFVQCRTQSSYEDALARGAREGRLTFEIEAYRHGDVHYSIRNTMDYVDRRWDVGPAGVFILSAEQQEEYRVEMEAARANAGALNLSEKGSVEMHAALLAAPMEAVVKMVNSLLDRFSSYANGEIYGVITEVARWNPEQGEWNSTEDACWRFVGRSYAEGELKDRMDNRVASAGLESRAPFI